MDGKVINSIGPRAPPGTQVPCASWSRRRFVAHGFMAMSAVPALSGAVMAVPALGEAIAGRRPVAAAPAVGGARTPASGGSEGDTSQGDGSGLVRTAGTFDDRLTTSVHVNGKGPYRFLVDTGAERTLLAADVAAQLGLPQGRKVLVEGVVRGEPAVLVRIASLRMGSLVSAPLEVPVLPRKMLQVDGYLGLDVLDKHRVVFDFRRRTLSVMRPQGFFAALWEHWDEAVVHTLGRSGRLRAANCLVGDVRAAAFIDTGAEVSVANPALYASLQRSARAGELGHGSVGLYGVTGGSIVGQTTNIKDIRLGDLHLTYTPFVVAALEVFDVWGLSREPALLFGMDCLRRFARVSIDYGRKELRFEVASASAVQPLEATLSPPLNG